MRVGGIFVMPCDDFCLDLRGFRWLKQKSEFKCTMTGLKELVCGAQYLVL